MVDIVFLKEIVEKDLEYENFLESIKDAFEKGENLNIKEIEEKIKEIVKYKNWKFLINTNKEKEFSYCIITSNPYIIVNKIYLKDMKDKNVEQELRENYFLNFNKEDYKFLITMIKELF